MDVSPTIAAIEAIAAMKDWTHRVTESDAEAIAAGRCGAVFSFLSTPCPCGCDFREVEDHVGYWSTSDGQNIVVVYAMDSDQLEEIAQFATDLGAQWRNP